MMVLANYSLFQLAGAPLRVPTKMALAQEQLTAFANRITLFVTTQAEPHTGPRRNQPANWSLLVIPASITCALMPTP